MKRPPEPTVDRFKAWTDRRGAGHTARELGVSPGHVSHLRNGNKHPSLDLATKIETLSGGWIRATDWVSR